MVGLKSREDEQIVRYLLDALPPVAAARVEERYFCEGPFFDRVIEIEEQLIRRYLDGKLSPTDASQFERKYLQIPELHRKVDFIRQLREKAFEANPTEQAAVHLERENVPWWHSLGAVSFASVSAVLITLLGIGAWLAVVNSRLRTEISELRRSTQQTGSGDGINLITSPEQVLTVILTPGLTKSLVGDKPARVAWTPDLKEIRMEFELPGLTGDPLLALEIERVGAERRTVILERSGLRSVSTPSGRTLLFVSTPTELPAGDYVASVKQEAPGAGGVLETYSFAVSRP
jgi:hypothetical protein